MSLLAFFERGTIYEVFPGFGEFAGGLEHRVGTDEPSRDGNRQIGNPTLTIKYCARSIRGRQIFGAGGQVMGDATAPIWRAGANDATAFHTDADLTVGSLAVPKGDYTLYVNAKDPDAWELVISKQTGQWGTEYDASKDLGRVKMEMKKPPAPLKC